MATLEERILEAINLSRAASKNKLLEYLPSIVQALEKIAISINDKTVTREARIRMSAGLGRLILEDYTFAESDLGGTLIKIADEFESYFPT